MLQYLKDAFSRFCGAIARLGTPKERRGAPEIQAQIVDALSIYLGGNQDLDRLRLLAKEYPDGVRETILRCQNMVAGRRNELGELTITLGYVQEWCHQTRSKGVLRRRKAFSYIAAMAQYGPVRRTVGAIPVTALADSDEQVRVYAARILVASGEPAAITQVFSKVLGDTPCVRAMVGVDLRRHALMLCQEAIPQALRSENRREALQMMVSWECSLYIQDVGALVRDRDPEVRVDCMRLLPFLPATRENRAALQSGLADEHPDVSAAAAAAGCVILPNASLDSLVPGRLAVAHA